MDFHRFEKRLMSLVENQVVFYCILDIGNALCVMQRTEKKISK